MRVASVQMCSTENVQENIDKACRYIDEAAVKGVDLVVLPEFFNTLFFAQYQDPVYHHLAEADTGRTITAIREAATQRNRIAVVATIYEKVEAGLYFDTAMHIDSNGAIVFKYRKVHPAAVLSLEKIYFRYGTRFDTYAFEDWRVGIVSATTWDFRKQRVALAVNGAELLIAPYATSRVNMFQEVLRTRAFENGCYMVAANKVGREGGWTFGGNSLITAPNGAILQSADGQSEALLVANIDRVQVDEARIAYPSRRDRRPDLYRPLVKEADADL